MIRTTLYSFVVIGTLASSTTLWAGKLPMPPTFNIKSDEVTILRDYPLGMINELAAFTHHGQPDHRVNLPNGKTGWVYEVYDQKLVNYQQPNGNKSDVKERLRNNLLGTYTLVFDDTKTVIDVMFDGKGFEFGVSSVQVQRHDKPEQQQLPNHGHEVHFAPGPSARNY